jgi:hypothetical protein
LPCNKPLGRNVTGVGHEHGGGASKRIAVVRVRVYVLAMRLRLKIPNLFTASPADQLVLHEAMKGLERARKNTCFCLGELALARGCEPDGETLDAIDAQFKLLGIIMALKGDIAALLRRTAEH